jgi:hypothetical protein
LLRFARNDGGTTVLDFDRQLLGAATLPRSQGGFENFFIIFVDRIFTTFIERPFTNAFGETSGIAIDS